MLLYIAFIIAGIQFSALSVCLCPFDLTFDAFIQFVRSFILPFIHIFHLLSGICAICVGVLDFTMVRFILSSNNLFSH